MADFVLLKSLKAFPNSINFSESNMEIPDNQVQATAEEFKTITQECETHANTTKSVDSEGKSGITTRNYLQYSTF